MVTGCVCRSSFLFARLLNWRLWLCRSFSRNGWLLRILRCRRICVGLLFLDFVLHGLPTRGLLRKVLVRLVNTLIGLVVCSLARIALYVEMILRQASGCHSRVLVVVSRWESGSVWRSREGLCLVRRSISWRGWLPHFRWSELYLVRVSVRGKLILLINLCRTRVIVRLLNRLQGWVSWREHAAGVLHSHRLVP